MVVTRFAPSPTGSLHVGGLRTALFNWAYAKKHGGKFILRIEDTDEVRSTDESLKGIVRDLNWAGIRWDEGPSYNPNDLRNNQVGDSGPYFQSQRKDIYNAEIDRLLKADMAYEKDGAVLFRMPKQEIVVKDKILGDVTYGADQAQDMVIRKATGMPTYHFAVVVDDEKMGVTTIIRGQEHLGNAWKHMHIQNALGYKTPEYAHIPLIMNLDGSKMSKRQKEGQVNTLDFAKDGYTVEALLNFLALLGWSHPDGLEHFDALTEMPKVFDLANIGKANAKFDYKKLRSFNSDMIKSWDIDRYVTKAGHFAVEHQDDRLEAFQNTDCDIGYFYRAYKDRSETLADPLIKGEFFYKAPQEYDEKALRKYFMNGKGIEILTDLSGYFSNPNNKWNKETLDSIINEYVGAHGYKMGDVAQTVRVAMTGNTVSPGLVDTLLILGRDEVLKRIYNCTWKLAGVAA